MARKFIDNLPAIEISEKYVLFKPLKDVDPKVEEPVIIVFLANPDQLSGLTNLAHFTTERIDNVYIAPASGCQSIAAYPYQEARSEKPRAVIGFTDFAARLFTRKVLDPDVLSFAVPLKLYQEMEKNVEDSFLTRKTWRELTQP